MTESYMPKTLALLQNPPQFAKPRRHRWHRTLQGLIFVFLTGIGGLMMTGCSDFWGDVGDSLRIGDGGGDAEAQEQIRTRVKTYVIETDGFEIVLDNDADPTPVVEVVSDGATSLRMASEGTMVLGTGDRILLELDDVVILRLNGATGSATLIRND